MANTVYYIAGTCNTNTVVTNSIQWNLILKNAVGGGVKFLYQDY